MLPLGEGAMVEQEAKRSGAERVRRSFMLFEGLKSDGCLVIGGGVEQQEILAE